MLNLDTINIEGNSKHSRAKKMARANNSTDGINSDQHNSKKVSPETTQRAPSSQGFGFNELLIGATPLLAGFLMGEPGIGASAGGQALLDYNQSQIEANKAKIAALRSKGRTNLVKTAGDKGQPIFTNVENAEGMQAYEKPGTGLTFEQRKQLEILKQKGKKAPNLFKNERDLRADYSKDDVTKNTKSLAQSFAKIQKIATSPQTGANDIALVFSFMKMLDPGSVVREGEQATARNAGSVPDNVRQMYNRLLAGEDSFLPDNVRTNFLNEASKQYDSQLELQRSVDSEYTRMARQYELNPNNVVIRPSVNKVKPPYVEQDGVLFELQANGEYKEVQK